MPIDWDQAMEQVGGDREFLSEVLQDLLNESQTAEEEISAGIKANNFDAISKAAHRIKGSASYLCCEPLRIASLHLQEAGHSGTETGDKKPDLAKLMEQIKGMYTHFQETVLTLRVEIEKFQA